MKRSFSHWTNILKFAPGLSIIAPGSGKIPVTQGVILLVTLVTIVTNYDQPLPAVDRQTEPYNKASTTGVPAYNNEFIGVMRRQRSNERSSFQRCLILRLKWVKLFNLNQRSKVFISTSLSVLFLGVKGQERSSDFQLCPIWKVKVSNCSSWLNDWKCPWWPLRTTFP